MLSDRGSHCDRTLRCMICPDGDPVEPNRRSRNQIDIRELSSDMADFLPFAIPDIGEAEISAVADCMRSGWLTTGPRTRAFEEAFVQYLGGDVEAVAVNSATGGLHLALEAAGVGQGDEVITSPYTFTATAEVIRYVGGHPVFVDVEPGSLNIDPTAIEAAIGPHTRAIIPVHFGGLGCRMEPILEIAARHGLKVIEDAAHALPTVQGGGIIGTHPSDAVVFSFYATKGITTGEGGMVVTRSRVIAERCRVMRLHGIDRGGFDRHTASSRRWYYEVAAPGFKYNMTDVAAAIGIEQLKRLGEFHRRRREIAAAYSKAFADLPLQLPEEAPPGDAHSWHLYVVRLTPDAPVDRDTFIEKMAERGIGCSVHFIPLHIQRYWRDTYRYDPEDYPVAYDAYLRAVSLPLHTRISRADQERVIEAVRRILS
jgi:UDP-4-amino-4-deoxy-L-arabinose-oxoglutarate aminotransferase